MAIKSSYPEIERKRSVERMLNDYKITLTPERRKELEIELEQLETTIRIKNRELLDNAYSGIIPTTTNREENKMENEWPKDAKLVKQRVALIEEELKKSIEEICKGDDKVIVSALGKVLKYFREDKKSSKVQKE